MLHVPKHHMDNILINVKDSQGNITLYAPKTVAEKGEQWRVNSKSMIRLQWFWEYFIHFDVLLQIKSICIYSTQLTSKLLNAVYL